jgi:signal transduction histidine kinase
MHATARQSIPWLLGWLALTLAGTFVIVRYDIAQRRDAFESSARIAHRLLSQRAAQHDAIMETLDLLSPAIARAARPELRLPAVHPQVLAVLRRDGEEAWPEPALRVADTVSRETRRAALGPIDAQALQFMLVRAGTPTSFALRIDLKRMVPWDEWPLERDGPVAASLVLAGRTLVLQPGAPTEVAPTGLTAGFHFAKPLDAPSQPFELRLQRATGPAEWPWWLLFAWAGVAALTVAGLGAWQRQQRGRRRAEALVRVGQVAQLNALGELAGGIAHELNQPLAAVLANAQAARRLLDDDPPALATARDAMGQAAAQARRASDVLARLRRLVEQPDAARPREPVRLDAALRKVLDLLEPVARRRGIRTTVEGWAPAVQADPVALEQILHNLIGNAMQALDEVPREERRLRLHIGTDHGQGVMTVCDSGPGIAPETLPRLFEPFFTTRTGGLGLGLSLCETLATAMQGSLRAGPASPRGAEFRLALPLAEGAA